MRSVDGQGATSSSPSSRHRTMLLTDPGRNSLCTNSLSSSNLPRRREPVSLLRARVQLWYQEGAREQWLVVADYQPPCTSTNMFTYTRLLPRLLNCCSDRVAFTVRSASASDPVGSQPYRN